MINTEELHTTLSIVAFMDVLGSKEFIMENADLSLNKIHNCYVQAIDAFTQKFSKDYPLPTVNIFSDNIVISLECNDSDEQYLLKSLYSIIAFCSIILVYFWSEGLLVRGAITIDSFFSNEVLVWGDALVIAHQLESSIAIYPRIILDPKLNELFEIATKPHKSNWLCYDYDGLYFIDPFRNNNESSISLLRTFANENIKRINNTPNNKINVLQKLNWLQQYFDDKLAKHNESP